MADPSHISYTDMKFNFHWDFNGSALKPERYKEARRSVD